MANGINLTKLRRDVKRHSKVVTHEDLLSVWNQMPMSRTMILRVLDSEYTALPKAVWNSILVHLGIGHYTYETNRRDCDDFAFALRGCVPLGLEVNGIGVVLDWSGRHAYNAVLVYSDGCLTIEFIEPQGDNADQWWVRSPGNKGMYDMDDGTVLF